MVAERRSFTLRSQPRAERPQTWLGTRVEADRCNKEKRGTIHNPQTQPLIPPVNLLLSSESRAGLVLWKDVVPAGRKPRHMQGNYRPSLRPSHQHEAIRMREVDPRKVRLAAARFDETSGPAATHAHSPTVSTHSARPARLLLRVIRQGAESPTQWFLEQRLWWHFDFVPLITPLPPTWFYHRCDQVYEQERASRLYAVHCAAKTEQIEPNVQASHS